MELWLKKSKLLPLWGIKEDNLFTLEEMKRADEIISSIFKKAGASDKYRCTFHLGPHKFDLAMQQEAFEWFDNWLNPEYAL